VVPSRIRYANGTGGSSGSDEGNGLFLQRRNGICPHTVECADPNGKDRPL
jgi:hypothetical protein